jgi:hypothetical protein
MSWFAKLFKDKNTSTNQPSNYDVYNAYLQQKKSDPTGYVQRNFFSLYEKQREARELKSSINMTHEIHIRTFTKDISALLSIFINNEKPDTTFYTKLTSANEKLYDSFSRDLTDGCPKPSSQTMLDLEEVIKIWNICLKLGSIDNRWQGEDYDVAGWYYYIIFIMV